MTSPLVFVLTQTPAAEINGAILYSRQAAQLKAPEWDAATQCVTWPKLVPAVIPTQTTMNGNIRCVSI